MGTFLFLSKGAKKKLKDEELKRLVAIFTEKTGLPYIRLKEVRKPTSVFDSKFGGISYLSPGFAYPHNKYGKNKPLKLLAQLNFTQLPSLPDFPTDGILQFYISCGEDDLSGMNLDNLTDQGSFRVVYHQDIITGEHLLQSPPAFPSDYHICFPIEGEFALETTVAEPIMTLSDFRYNETFEKYLKNNSALEDIFANVKEDTIEEQLNETLYTTGHQIGGYPYFTQDDPRGCDDKLKGHTILLLQIDSSDDIMWGDAGVANFFITSDSLRNLDFSNVIYTWDCW